MATVTGHTAARMARIEAASVVGGSVVSGRLILRRFDGGTIDAGSVIGPTGATGAAGGVDSVNSRRGTVVITAADLGITADGAVGTSTTRRLGSAAAEAAPGLNSVGRVVYSGSLGTTRPTGYAMILWINYPARPTNMITGDVVLIPV